MARAEGERKRRSSLRVELVAWLAIVLMMAVISLSFTAEWLGQRRHDQEEIERLQSHAHSVAVLAGRSFRGGDFERAGLEELLGSSSALLGVSYEVHRLRGDGELERVAAVGVHAGFEELPAPSPRAGSRVDDSLLDRWNLLIIDEPVPTLGGQPVILRMVAEHSPWSRTVDWRETLIVAGGVGLVLLVLGGLLLELQVLRPMRALEQAVAQVGGGELEVEAPTEGPAEIGQLARAFNEMTASLRGQQAALETQAERLRRSERMAAVGRLAAGVAHEVGNPLAAIVGYTELLLGEPGLSDEARDLLERVAGQTERIQGIVGSLLDYSKPARREAVNVSPLERAREVVALLKADPRCADVELELIGDPELEARADPALVEQILINLVLNGARAAKAEDAQDDSPRVRIRVRAEPGEGGGAGQQDETPAAILVEVEDSGAGVAEDLRERLFEPFFTTQGAGEGTGLGLAVSQGLAEAMDGGLEFVANTGPGACFRLRLPAA